MKIHGFKPFAAILLLPLVACSTGSSNSSSSSSSKTGSDSSLSSSLSSQSQSSSSSSSSSSISSSFSSSSSSSLSSNVGEENYDAFWDIGNVADVSFSFSKESLYALSHYGAIDSQRWADVYFPATIRIAYLDSSFSFDEVGVRMKGNTSRSEFVNQDGTFMDGRYAHLKVSFKATFDDELYDLAQFKAFKHDWSSDPDGRKARKKRTFCSMEKLDFKYVPRNNSKTLSQEMYCYKSFRDEGILAPNAKWGSVSISSGVATRSMNYEIIEDIDKQFLKNRLGSSLASGDLYKCVWGQPLGANNWTGANLSRTDAVEKSFDNDGYCNGARVANGRIGVEDNYNWYHPNYQLKTNDDGENSDFSKMAGFINAAHSCRYEAGPLSVLENVLNIDEFLHFEAVSFLLGNFDDQRMNYNNYYLYFNPSDNKAIYIPYDWDWSLGNSNNVDMANLDPFYTSALSGETNVNNLYWDTILDGSKNSDYSLDSMKETYLSYMKNAMDSVLSNDAYTSFIQAAPNKSDSSSVLSYMGSKRSFLNMYFEK